MILTESASSHPHHESGASQTDLCTLIVWIRNESALYVRGVVHSVEVLRQHCFGDTCHLLYEEWSTALCFH